MKLREIVEEGKDFRIVCRKKEQIKNLSVEEVPKFNIFRIKVNGEEILEFKEPLESKRKKLRKFLSTLDTEEVFGKEKEDVYSKLLELDVPGCEEE